MASRARDLGLLAPACLTLAVLFGGALAGVVRTSLVPLGGGAGLQAWEDLRADPGFADAAAFTLRVTALSTLLAAAAGLGLAALLRSRGTLPRALAALPVPVPHLLVATVAVLWLGPGGLADRLLGALPFELVRDRAGLGIVLVYVYKEAPFLALLVLAACGRDLRAREEAAAVLGAGPWQRWRWVTWPAVRAPLVVGAIIVAAYVAGSFEVPLLVGPNAPPTVAAFAYEATQGDVIAGQGKAAAALLLVSAFSIALAAAVVRFARDVEGA
jgi:putative spermidine/putrescine transport system permease protein